MQQMEYYDTIAHDAIATVTIPALAFIASNGVLAVGINVTRIKAKFTFIKI